MPFMANLADQTFVDDLGRRVYLSKPPHRIVSLAPSVTEILFAVGLDAEVVGVTTFCDYPAQAKTRPKIGAAIPNLETILGLKPDLATAGENIVGRAQAPYPKVSVEEVLRQDPEVILFPVGAAEGIPEAEQQFWRRWPNLSAVSHNRLHPIKGELINRPGPRVIDGTELMARYLHPELFPATGGAKAR